MPPKDYRSVFNNADYTKFLPQGDGNYTAPTSTTYVQPKQAQDLEAEARQKAINDERARQEIIASRGVVKADKRTQQQRNSGYRRDRNPGTSEQIAASRRHREADKKATEIENEYIKPLAATATTLGLSAVNPAAGAAFYGLMATPEAYRMQKEGIRNDEDAINAALLVAGIIPAFKGAGRTIGNGAKQIAGRIGSKLPKAHQIVDYGTWTPEQWDKDYFSAIKKGDFSKVQELRDAHFINNAPNTKIVDEKGIPLKTYHTSHNKFNSFKESLDNEFDGFGVGNYFSKDVVDRGPIKYEAYLKSDNPYIAKHKQDLPTSDGKSVRFNNIDNKYLTENHSGVLGLDGREITIYDPKNIKSADAVTYDDKGEVIPLSKRDDFNVNDIRYSQHMTNFTPQKFNLLTDKQKDEAIDYTKWFFSNDVIPRINKSRKGFYNSRVFENSPYIGNAKFKDLGDTRLGATSPTVLNDDGMNYTVTLNEKLPTGEAKPTAIHEFRHDMQNHHSYQYDMKELDKLQKEIQLAKRNGDYETYTQKSQMFMSEISRMMKPYLQTHPEVHSNINAVGIMNRTFSDMLHGYTQEERNILQDAYKVNKNRSRFDTNELGTSENIKERGAFNTELRSRISADNDNVYGSDLDKVIDSMSDEQLLNYFKKDSSYGAVYYEYLEGLPKSAQSEALNRIRNALKIVGVTAGIAVSTIKPEKKYSK